MSDNLHHIITVFVFSSIFVVPVLLQLRREVRFGTMLTWAFCAAVLSSFLAPFLPTLFYQCISALLASGILWLIRPRRSIVVAVLLTSVVSAFVVG